MSKFAACLLTAILPISANAATFAVYTGYADNVHSSTFTPTPWVGDPSVVSQTTAGPIDGGAIRVFDTGTTPIAVSNVVVDFAGQVFKLWADQTIQAGQSAVFAQTSPYGNFDTSDFGGKTATISFAADGTASAFTDNGVIDTGGSDPGYAGTAGVNEGLPWTFIGDGSAPDISQFNVVPEPSSLSVLVAGLIGLSGVGFMVRRGKTSVKASA